MVRARKLRRLLISLDITQHNALVIFTVKRSTISGISQKLLKVICGMRQQKESNEEFY